MTAHENEPGHGHSVAAWTTVITITLGVSIATLGVVLPEGILSIIGGVVVGIGCIAGPVLAKLGYGVAGKTK